MKRGTILLLSLALMALPVAALADSLIPETYTTTMAVGETATLAKQLTVNAGTPTTAQADVFFLADTTGSMYSYLGNVRTNASTILSSVSALGNVQFGVGDYRDFATSPWGSAGDYPYRLGQAVTASTAAAQAAINGWVIGNGNDTPESQIYALNQVATQAATGWREDSRKIVVWFGDSPGHEPSNTAGYPGPSTATAISNLNGANITVEAINVGYGAGVNSYGQASSIASATGGTLFNNPVASTLSQAIIDAIGRAFSTYHTVELRVEGLAPGLEVSWTPPSFTGDYNRSMDQLFNFDLSFTALAAGVYDFSIAALVDGGVVARETDSITVTGRDSSEVPEPGTMMLLGSGLVTLAGMRKKLLPKR